MDDQEDRLRYEDVEFVPNLGEPDLSVGVVSQRDEAIENAINGYFDQTIFDSSTRIIEPPKWMVRDTIEEGGIAFVGGQSAAGKSFIVLELARCLTTGAPFFGRNVDTVCGFVLFAPEGQRTIDSRVAAMKRAHGIVQDLPFAYLGRLPSLESPQGRKIVVGLLKRINDVFIEKFGLPLGAVAMDTLAATFEIKDQNDNSEAARRIAMLREIQDGLGFSAVMLPVHHYGKQADVGLTGGHGWKAGADQVLSVLAERDQVTGECFARELALAKNRSGSDGPISPFDLVPIVLGTLEDGTDWGSVFVRPSGNKSPLETRKKPLRTKKNERAFHDAFLEAMIGHKRSVRIAGGTGPDVQAVALVPHVRDAFFTKYAAVSDDPFKSFAENSKTSYDTKRKAFQRVVSQLSDRYSVETIAGTEYVWEVNPY